MASDKGHYNGKKYNSRPMEGITKDSRYKDNALDEDLSWYVVVKGKKNNISPSPTQLQTHSASLPHPPPTHTSKFPAVRYPQEAPGATRALTHQWKDQQASQLTRNQDKPADLGKKLGLSPLNKMVPIATKSLSSVVNKMTVLSRWESPLEKQPKSCSQMCGDSNLVATSRSEMRFSGCPTVCFKLKQQTNIDNLISVEHFNIEWRAPNSKEIDYIRPHMLGKDWRQ